MVFALGGTELNIMEEKWKLTKKEGSRSRSSTSTSTSFKYPSLVRSFSTKCTSSSSSAPTASSSLPRSSSLKYSSSSPRSPPMRSLSQKGSSFTRKCNSLAKEQKARFYILRRCVTMLVCWRKYGDRN
ncbi:DVL protein [Dillenia turbinata]|uniref:DVL protein n=1 Tax=Dillenia turbinata TaxID=194707 RepID=A0AAN8Z591_9MAGN